MTLTFDLLFAFLVGPAEAGGEGGGIGAEFGAGLRVGYLFTERVSATAAAEWQVIPEMRGDTTIYAPDGTETNPDSAGIANQWMLLSFSLGYAF